MTAWGSALHTDANSKSTSASYGDRGDGTSTWFMPVRIYDGGDTAQGDKDDAAVTDPTASATIVALLKGILTANRLSAAGMLKAEDAAHASGDSGIMALGVRSDTLAALAGTTGDYTPFQVDALGRLYVTGSYAEDAAHSSGDYGQFILGVQSLTRTSRSADGDYTPVAVDAAGAVFVTQVPNGNSAWSPTTYSAHAAASGVIKASAGKLYHMVFDNDNAAARYVQFFNTTSVPADGTAPMFAIKLAAGDYMDFDFGEQGLYFSTGISWCLSTTFATKTLAGADASIAGTYL